MGVTAGGAFLGKEESVPQFAAKSIRCSQPAEFRRGTEQSHDGQVSRWPPADLPPPPRLANGVGRLLVLDAIPPEPMMTDLMCQHYRDI